MADALATAPAGSAGTPSIAPPIRSTTGRRRHLEALTRHAETLAQANPRRYRWRVAALALLGYLVVGGTLLALIALIVGGIWGALASTAVLVLLLQNKLGIALIVLAWMLARALWVRLEEPTGRVLTRAEFRALFADIDEIRKRLDTRSLDAVVLTAEFNASISLTPRFGVIGPHRVTLVIGLELLLALSRREACAVLAHELGHLSRAHGRFGNWIYRLRTTWYRLMHAFDEASGVMTRLLRRFFDWYAPYFNAYSFTLARAAEFEADQLSARVTSPAVAAAALVATTVTADTIGERFWKEMYGRADAAPEPPGDVYGALARFVETHRRDVKDRLERLRSAVAVRTESENTHPALKDRLAALNEYPSLNVRSSPSAARAWFGECYEEILAGFSRDWHDTVRSGWIERHAAAQRSRAQFAALLEKDPATLTQADRWNLATWTQRYAPERDSLLLFEEYARAFPNDREADYTIGQLKLARGDASGLTHLENALSAHRLVLPACELAYAFLLRADDRSGADRWRQRAEHQLDAYEAARRERERLTNKDELIPSSLPEAHVLALAQQLRAFERLKGAWVAQKKVTLLPDEPVLVIAYETRGWRWSRDKLHARLANEVDWPALTYFVPKSSEFRRLRKTVFEIGTRLI
jgi:Zn-dependent protease with chaperone function